MRDERVLALKEQTEGILNEIDPACSIHDFRVVHGEAQTNLIFDMVIPIEYDEEKRNKLPLTLMGKIQELDSRYQCVITVEYNYVAKE